MDGKSLTHTGTCKNICLMMNNIILTLKYEIIEYNAVIMARALCFVPLIMWLLKCCHISTCARGALLHFNVSNSYLPKRE